jgi:hypothetical protein
MLYFIYCDEGLENIFIIERLIHYPYRLWFCAHLILYGEE